MLKTTILFCSLFVGILNAQTSKRVQEIENQLQKSYYTKIFKFDKKYLKEKAKTFACIEKNYPDIKIFEEKEFLNKSDFFKKYPGWTRENNSELEQRSILEEANEPLHWYQNESMNFPKCLKWSER